MKDNPLDLKILIIGSLGGGKTSFSDRWTKNMFNYKTKATIVSDFGF